MMENTSLPTLSLYYPTNNSAFSTEIDRSSQPKWVKALRKLPYQVRIVGHLLRIYLTKGIDAEALRGTVR
jgi:hypothetical protein